MAQVLGALIFSPLVDVQSKCVFIVHKCVLSLDEDHTLISILNSPAEVCLALLLTFIQEFHLGNIHYFG